MNFKRYFFGLLFFIGMMTIAKSQSPFGKVKAAHVKEPIVSVLKAEKKANSVILTCDGKRTLKITIERDDILRIQALESGKFETALPIKLGFVKDNFPLIPFTFNDEMSTVTVSTSKYTLKITKSPFSISLLDAKMHFLTGLAQSGGIAIGDSGNRLTFQMSGDEHFYGFGFMRSTFDARGKKLTWKRYYRWQEATVPYFMSTRNYGFYSNNTWDHEFNFTSEDASKGDQYTVDNKGGALDFYLLVGDDFKAILNTYTDLTGKPWMPPKWSYGLSFRCRTQENQVGALAIAKKFREHDIPIDIIALEPGWESVNYGDTWEWNSERFPDPKGMITEMNSMGYHFDLWDKGTAPTKDILKESGRKAWYAKRTKLIDMGVNMFKQDDPYPRGIKSEGYDPANLNKFSLATGKYKHEELINIANSIYSETAFNEFKKQTGKRYATQFHAYNASIASHRWPYQWGGDFTADNGMLNSGLSGHSLSSEDMRDFSPKGLHHDYLTPVPVLDAWAYFREPWLFSSKVEADHRFYARLRQKLAPYIYSSVWQSHTNALPLMRPMVLAFQTDRNTLNMCGEYMFGDWLLVVADPSKTDEFMGTDFTQKDDRKNAYLPTGEWINYWTGEVYRVPVGQNYNVMWPDYAGGALLVKAGAIIPVGRANSYTDETPYQVVNLEIFPYKTSSYTLYEDDGVTYDYEAGKYCTTTFHSSKDGNNITVRSDKRQGSYNTMPGNRSYFLKVFSELPPAKVSNCGEVLTRLVNKETLAYQNAKGWVYDEASKKILIKTSPNWKLVKNTRRVERNSVMDMELDDIQFVGETHIEEQPLDVLIELDARPVIDARFSENNIPADGLSKTFLFAYCKDAMGTDAHLAISGETLTIEGPATFEDGKRTIELTSVLNKNIPLYVTKESGIVKLKATSKARLVSKELIVSGEQAAVAITPLQEVMLADGVSKALFRIELRDKDGRPAIPSVRTAKIHVSGEGKLPKGQEFVKLQNGLGTFEILSTNVAGTVAVSVEVDNVKSEEFKMSSVKGKLSVITNPPEEMVFHTGNYVTWIPTKVDVMVHITANGKTITSFTGPIHLKVLDINRKIKCELTAKCENGEAIFTGVDYYSRPGKCYFVISSEGYDEVELKIFENTWSK